MKCETCQSEATVHIKAIGCHFCASCLKKIDERFAEINAPKRPGVDTFEMVASYADGRHYADTSTHELDALMSAKEHIEKPECDYVRIMRQREMPNAAGELQPPPNNQK